MEQVYAVCDRAGNPITYFDMNYDGWPRQLTNDPKIKVISVLILKNKFIGDKLLMLFCNNNKYKISVKVIKNIRDDVYMRELVFVSA